MFIIYGDIRSLGQDELQIRRRGLRNMVISLGWWTLVTTNCYIILYFLVYANSESDMAFVIRMMALAIIPVIIIKGLVLIYGASQQKMGLLEIGLWFTLLIAVHNMVLGIMGATHFIHSIRVTAHFVLFIVFVCLSLSFLNSILFDVLIIVAYKKLLNSI